MKNKKGISLIALLIIIILVLFVIFVLFAVNSDNNSNSSSNYKDHYTQSSPTTDTDLFKNKTYGLGDTITFDNLELTFDSTYSFATIENQFSEYNGRTAIKLGVNVKNISNEKHSLNMFFYDLFGSQGIQLDSISSYFDDNIDFAGDLKPNASYKSYFYILYDGNGSYSIDFDNFSQEISVEFNVTK